MPGSEERGTGRASVLRGDPAIRRRLRRAAQTLPLIAIVVLLAACTFEGPTMTIQNDRSPENREIWGLYSLVWWLALMVFIIVEVALFYAVFRFRRRPGQGLPKQTHGNNRLEVAWTIAPALLLVLIAVPTVRTIINQASPSTDPNTVRIAIIGHQFWWEAQYLGIRDAQGRPLNTANEIHVPVGRTIEFEITSADVQHSFWVPLLGGKMDALPTRINRLKYTPTEPGRYYGQCAELCGTAHGFMKFYLVVDTEADFQAWVAGQQQRAQAATDDQIRRGEQLVLGGACVSCHYIEGTAAQGRIGPNLTGYGNRETMAAGWVDNTEENVKRWIRNPGDIKPGAVRDPETQSELVQAMRMPAFPEYTEEELTAIAKYLLSLR
jgi:cytochrome c oxidase subunit II